MENKPKLIEGIAEILERGIVCPYQKKKADQILNLLYELGYRKVPKLKVLEEGEARYWIQETYHANRFLTPGEYMEAQLDSIQKQIEEAN